MPLLNLLPAPRDANTQLLPHLGTEWFTTRLAVADSAFSEVTFPYDVKGITIHWEGDGAVAIVRGTLPGVKAFFDAAAVVNNEDGTVTIPITDCPFVATETVTITGTTNYDGDYTAETGTSTSGLVITETYAEETLSSKAYGICHRDAYITSNGAWLEVPVCAEAGTVLANLKSASGDKNVSVIGWR